MGSPFDDEDRLLNQAIFSSLLDSRPSTATPAAAPSNESPTSSPLSAVVATATARIDPISAAIPTTTTATPVVATVANAGQVFVARPSSGVASHEPSSPATHAASPTVPTHTQDANIVAPTLLTTVPSVMIQPSSPHGMTSLPPSPRVVTPRSSSIITNVFNDGNASPINIIARSLSTDKDKHTTIAANRSGSGNVMSTVGVAPRAPDTSMASMAAIDVIHHCHQILKYPLTRCVKAYSMYVQLPLSQRDLQQKMIAFLSQPRPTARQSSTTTNTNTNAAIAGTTSASSMTLTGIGGGSGIVSASSGRDRPMVTAKRHSKGSKQPNGTAPLPRPHH
jgi:hypothetical protein